MCESGFEDEPLSGDSTAESHEYGYLDHIYTKDQPETFQIIYQWRTLLDEYSNEKGDYSRYVKSVITLNFYHLTSSMFYRIIMTESATTMTNVMLYYGNEETGEIGAHFSFNFNLLGTFSSAKSVVDSVLYWLDYMPTIYTANWLVILQSLGTCLFYFINSISIDGKSRQQPSSYEVW